MMPIIWPAGRVPCRRSPVYAPNGIVATSQPLASAAGLAVLQRGGNAIDAAVTAAAVLSVTEPMMTGVGGDMFAIIWLAKEKKLVALNASGRAGSLMTRDELIEEMGFRPDQITVVHPGVDQRFVPGAGKTKNPHVMAVARLVPVKNFARLIRIMVRVREAVPNAYLSIVGDGYEREQLNDLIGELGAHGEP